MTVADIRFAGPEFAPVAGPLEGARPRPTPFDPYQPALSRIVPSSTFRIGTGLLIIAVIAVCLGALRADLSLGIIATVSLIPAAIRTPLVAGRRRFEGRPMSLGEQINTFTITMFATWVAVISLVSVILIPAAIVTPFVAGRR